MRRGDVLAGGAVASALAVGVSWVCCLPVAVAILGGGSLGVGLFLAEWRAWLTGSSVVLLVGAVALGKFLPATACDRRASSARPWLWLAGLVTLALLSLPLWLDWAIYWSL